MNYPIYGNNSQFFMNDLQAMRDKIDRQMQQIQMQQQQTQQMQQMQQPTNLTQNFQLAPNNTSNNDLESKYANNIEEVKNTLVIKTGIFTTKDFSTIWVKDVTGKIRTFKTEEIIEMDEKDKEIYMLKRQVEELRRNFENPPKESYEDLKREEVDKNEFFDANVVEPTTKTKSTRVSSSKQSNAK